MPYRTFFGVNRAELVVKGDKSPKAEIEAEFLTAVEKRSSGYPCNIFSENGLLWIFRFLWARVFLFREMIQKF